MKDWTGNKVSYISTNGFANNRDYDRDLHDYYATEPKAVEMLLDIEDFIGFRVWECACGGGHLSKSMIKKGIEVYSSDIVDRGYGLVYDFLSIDNIKFDGHIITNPPYKYANEFIKKSLSIVPIGCKVAMFLPIRYLEGKARKEMFRILPPKVIYVSSSRIKCAMNGKFDEMSGSAVSYAWFVWYCGYKGDTVLKWFN